MIAVIKKELKSYFLSPIGYVVVGIFLIAYSTFFCLTSLEYSTTDLNSIFYDMALYGLMFVTPLITMSTFSGEKKSGTDQLLLTAPVSMKGVVIAKFIASFLLILIPTLFTLMHFGILCFFKVPDVTTYLTTLIGFILLSMTFISFGILSSSIAKSPIVAGILTFAIILATNWGLYQIESLSEYSLIDRFIAFLYGQIDITSVVLFITITILCLLITMIIMQRKKSIK